MVEGSCDAVFLNMNDPHVYYVSLHVSYIYTILSMSTRKLGSSLFCVIVLVSLLIKRDDH